MTNVYASTIRSNITQIYIFINDKHFKCSVFVSLNFKKLNNIKINSCYNIYIYISYLYNRMQFQFLKCELKVFHDHRIYYIIILLLRQYFTINFSEYL